MADKELKKGNFNTINRTSLLRVELSTVHYEDGEECWLRIDTLGSAGITSKSHMANIKPEMMDEYLDHILSSLLNFVPKEKEV